MRVIRPSALCAQAPERHIDSCAKHSSLRRARSSARPLKATLFLFLAVLAGTLIQQSSQAPGAAGRAFGLLRRGRAARSFAPGSHPVAAECTSSAGSARSVEGGWRWKAHATRAHTDLRRSALGGSFGTGFSRARVGAARLRRNT